MEEVIRLKGSLELILKSAFDGSVVERRKIENTVVTAGRSWVLGQLISSNIATAQTISYLGVGTSTASPTTADTTLGSETTRLAIGTFTTTGMTSNPPSWVAAVSFATNLANTTLAEAGMFNSSAAGTMFNHATFATLNKTTSNTLTVSFTVSN